MKVLIKAMRPHRQKVLTEDGEELRLQQWANKQAASAMRSAGDAATGEQFTQARDALMRDAVANPQEHGLKFMGERMPFDGQTLEESLSEPDVEGEQGPGEGPDEWMGDESPEHFENVREKEGVEQFLKRPKPDIFDEQGNLRQTLPRGNTYTNVSYDANVNTPTDEEKKQMMAEKQKEFDADAEAEHLRRIMTSRDVAMRDAWTVLKNDFFNPPMVPCAKCGAKTEPMMYYGSNEMGPQHNTLCERCEDEMHE
jgi:hypothetical protein